MLKKIFFPMLLAFASLFASCQSSAKPYVYYVDKNSATDSYVPTIKVRLGEHKNLHSLVLKLSENTRIFAGHTEITLSKSALKQGVRVELAQTGFVLKNPDDEKILRETQSENLRFKPDNAPLKLVLHDGNADNLRIASDIILAKSADASFDVIVATDLETYVAQVLFNEMPKDFPLEALKAQTIATRSYALYKYFENEQRGSGRWAYDLESTNADTVFNPTHLDEQAKKICETTRGLVLAYKDFDGKYRMFLPYYHSTCGGATASAYDVFGTFRDLQPLSGVKLDACKTSPMYSWQRKFSWRNWRAKLISRGFATSLPTKLKSLKIADKDRFGRAKKLKFIFASAKPFVIDALVFRNQVAGTGKNDLPSVLITKIAVHGDTIAISGKGWGHGVGMCQWGAKGLAEKGWTFQDILNAFYPQAEILKHY